LALPPSEKVTAEARKDAEQFARECESKVCQIEVKVTGPFTVDGEPKAGRVIVTVGKPHGVLMEGPDGRKERQVTCAKAGETILVEYASTGVGTPPPPPPPPAKEEGTSGSWVLPGVLAGVGVVGLGVGIGLGAASSGADSDARALGSGVRCSSEAACSAVSDKLSSASSTGTGSVIGYVGGGVFLGTAVISAIVLKPWRTSSGAHAQLVPALGGVSLAGSF
jgi:hypothetical protein